MASRPPACIAHPGLNHPCAFANTAYPDRVVFETKLNRDLLRHCVAGHNCFGGLVGMFLFGWKRRKEKPPPGVKPLPPDDD